MREVVLDLTSDVEGLSRRQNKHANLFPCRVNQSVALGKTPDKLPGDVAPNIRVVLPDIRQLWFGEFANDRVFVRYHRGSTRLGRLNARHLPNVIVCATFRDDFTIDDNVEATCENEEDVVV